MANLRYLRCAKCGNPAFPHKAIIKDGQVIQQHETGTSTLMRCTDCCDPNNVSIPNNYYATMCRDCCPTGHGTHGENQNG